MPKKITTETRLYPLVIHREGKVFGYFSPEFGGGGAPTMQDALHLAQERIDDALALGRRNYRAEEGEVPRALLVRAPRLGARDCVT